MIEQAQGGTFEVTLDPARPAAERVALWRDAMSASGAVEIEDAAGFRGSFISRPLGELRTMRISSAPFRLVRDLAMAERVPRDHVLVNIVEGGTMRGRLAGRAFTARPGDLILSRLSNRMDVRLIDADWLALLIPLAILEQHMAWPGRIDGSVHRAGTLPAQLMTGIVRTACAQPETLHPSDAKRVQMAALSMLAIALDETPTPVTSAAFVREALASAIRRYLVAHLGDPELGVDTIGAAFGLSRHGVYRVLKGAGKGAGDVAAIIRRLRLQAILRDLTSDRNDGAPLAAIARRWGMPEERSFRRAFRQAFGCTPSAVRDGTAAPQSAPAIGAELERWFLGL